MKHVLPIASWILLLLFACGISSCQKETLEALNGDEGYISLKINDDIVPITVPGVKGAEALVPVYTIDIIDSKGATAATYPDHTELPDKIKVKAGTYTVRATSGKDTDAEFDSPYYKGETSVKVEAGADNPASITCTLANVKVSVSYTDVIKENFTSYIVTVSNDQNGTLIFDENEAQAGFFKCSGTLTWRINLINKNGTPFNMVKTIREVQPREHYKLVFNADLSGNTDDGGSDPDISVDESLNEQEHNIDIILNKKPKPLFSATGFTFGEPLMLALGEAVPCAVDIVSQAKINAVTITHNSQYLQSIGVPSSFDLTALDPMTASTVKTAGISWSDPIADAGEARIDLERLTGLLPVGEYKFGISVQDHQDQVVKKEIQMSVVSELAEVKAVSVNEWAKFADVSSEWTTPNRPEGIGFEYKTADASEWTDVPEGSLTVSGKTFSARITNLTPATVYAVRAVSAKQPGDETAFTTENATQIPNMGFDQWYKDGKPWYPNPSMNEADRWWDSGNVGANTLGEANPTAPEYTFVKSGGAAAKLESMAVTFVKVFAAGSVYLGDFGGTVGTSGAKLNFGKPYTCRPLRMSGYYHYTSGAIDKTKSPYDGLKGKMDSCHIYVVLRDEPFAANTSTGTFLDLKNDPKIIAFGEFKTDRSSPVAGSSLSPNDYVPFTIKLDYRDKVRKPKYAIIVASSSKYGDYFTGHVGSTLYLDELQFEFDPE